MPSDSKFTRDDDGNVAVRVVSNTGVSEQPESMFTTDEDGNVAVRVVFGEGGGGGGDSHNKGFYATPTALNEAVPTAEAGDYAIVGSTDTVWIWDTDNSEWVDSDQKGQVTSVNSMTGAVTLGINDVAPTQTGKSGYVLGTDGFVAGWIKLEQIQRSALPQASEEEVDKIYQYVGTTDANYTNGYFYKCVSDGQIPATYSWEQVDVQPSPDPLPSQTGNAGKFLTTDGTDASWSDKPLANTATGSGALTILGTATGYNNGINIGSGSVSKGEDVSVGKGATTESRNVAMGYSASAKTSYGGSVAIGYIANADISSAGWKASVAIGPRATANASGSIQISATRANNTTVTPTNSDANTFKVANDNGNFEIMSADGTVPSDRLVHAINKYSTMPTAASTNEGWIVQFTGTTDSTYTHGHLYECVSDGGNPATYSWTEVSMGGGSSYTAGTGIDITNNTISVASPIARLELASGSTVGSVYGMWAKTTTISPFRCLVLGHDASMGSTSASGAVVLGAEAVGGNGTVSVGARSSATVADGIAIGNAAKSTSSGAVQIGYGTNSTSNTFQWQSYRLVSSDGTIPTARLTKVNSTITLAAADWSSNTQTVNVTGMTATGVVFVGPDPTDQSAYTSAGVLCTAQAAGTLTFTCDTVPSGDIDVNVVML